MSQVSAPSTLPDASRPTLLPLHRVGSRFLPSCCPRARFEGEASLLAHPLWPGLEACGDCPFFHGEVAQAVACAAPGVSLLADGLCLEVDIFLPTGRKRRTLLRLGPSLSDLIHSVIQSHSPDRPSALDVKFVPGDPGQLEQEESTFMERWRFYFNGDRWVRKAPGDTLHDWNKWGRHLEFLSLAKTGGRPPQGGWPPVMDLPEGAYLLRVLDLHPATARGGERELEWVFRVLGGEERDRRVFYRASIRNRTCVRRFMRDLAIVLGESQASLPRPEQPSFDHALERVRGRLVRATVRLREGFTNIHLERVQRGSD